MRILKAFLLLLAVQSVMSCQSKSLPDPTLAGKWKITGAVRNDGRHWTGSFTLAANGDGYTGLFIWDAVDGKSSGTDGIVGTYNLTTRVLSMRSVAISGNIESVLYTVNVGANSRTMTGIRTGSSDGTIENPGSWAAEKE